MRNQINGVPFEEVDEETFEQLSNKPLEDLDHVEIDFLISRVNILSGWWAAQGVEHYLSADAPTPLKKHWLRNGGATLELLKVAEDFLPANILSVYKDRLAEIEDSSSGKTPLNMGFYRRTHGVSKLSMASMFHVHLPRFTDKENIEYFADLKGLIRNKPVSTSLGRYMTRVLKIQVEGKVLDEIAQEHRLNCGLVPVQFVANDDAQGWQAAYDSSGVQSCMKGEEGIQCYATSDARWKLPDNGLRLAYLGDTPDTAVARCIVYDKDGVKGYVRNYGDNYLELALEAAGYSHMGGFASENVFIATEEDSCEGYMAPYVDGDDQCGDLEHMENSEGESVLVFRITDSGRYNLTGTGSYAYTNTEECDECGADEDPDDMYVATGRWGEEVRICSCCEDNRYAYALLEGCSRLVHEDCIIGAETSNGATLHFADIQDNLADSEVYWSDYYQAYIRGDVILYNDDYYFDRDLVKVDYSTSGISEALEEDTMVVGNDTLITEEWEAEDYEGNSIWTTCPSNRADLEYILNLQGIDYEEYLESKG